MTRRKSFFDDIEEMFKRFRRLLDEQEDIYGLEGFRGGFSSAFSITVTYDDYGRPIVRVSAQGDVDRDEIERYIKERYPNAKIIWESEGAHVRPIEEVHVREISVQEHSDLKHMRRPRGVEIVELDSKKPRIYEVKVEGDHEDKKGKGWYDIKVE